MRKIGFTLGLFLLVSLCVAGAYAAGPAEGKKKKEAGAYNGSVAELDLKAARMVVAQDKSDLAMVFNTSRAKAGPGYKDLNEVKVGDPVDVKFEAKVGVIYALEVAKGKKVAGEPKPAAKVPHPAAK